MLVEQRVRGVLVSPFNPLTPHLERLRRRGIAVVLVSSTAGPEWCSVTVDDVEGGELAVQHLLDQGHRRIAFIGGVMYAVCVADRLLGARKAMATAGTRSGLADRDRNRRPEHRRGTTGGRALDRAAASPASDGGVLRQRPRRPRVAPAPDPGGDRRPRRVGDRRLRRHRVRRGCRRAVDLRPPAAPRARTHGRRAVARRDRQHCAGTSTSRWCSTPSSSYARRRRPASVAARDVRLAAFRPPFPPLRVRRRRSGGWRRRRTSRTCAGSPSAGCRPGSSTTSTAAPRTRSRCERIATRSAATSSARGSSATSRRSTRRRRCSDRRCRSRSCWRRRATRGSPIPQGELAVARAAERAGVPYTLSTMSTRSIEEVAAANGDGPSVVPGLRLEGSRPRARSRRACGRGRLRGARHHRRHRQPRAPRARRPARLHAAAQARARHDHRRHRPSGMDVALRPVRADPLRQRRHVQGTPAGSTTGRGRSASPRRCPRSSTRRCRGRTSSGSARSGTGRSCSRACRPSTTPASPSTTASRRSPSPTTAVASSTSAPAILELVAPVAEAVGGRVEIICDGGVRRGSDIVKALALGADACMVGRAYLYGLGAAGELGVDRVLEWLLEGVRRTMALLGVTTIGEITADHVRRRPG